LLTVNQMNKKVSVVIPFFQRQSGLLRKAVESALKQTGNFRIEIVIVDDESPVPARTEMADLLSKHTDKLVIVEQKNAGCFPAGNTGLNRVSPDADYIAFLDSDDEWFDGHIEHAVWALDQGYDFYFSDFYQLNQTVTAFNRAKRIDVQKHPRIHPSEPIHEYKDDMVNQIITGSVLGTSTIVYNRQHFNDVRYLENYKHTGPEYIFWIQLALRAKKIAFTSIPECRYGGGVNIFSEASWGTDKFLSVRHEEIKWRTHLLTSFALPNDQKHCVIAKIQQSRLGFAKGLLHNILHNGKVDGEVLRKQAKLDPKTFLLLPILPARIIYEKLNGSKSR
jgi:succinoglycan biosynthesis protein ExoW